MTLRDWLIEVRSVWGVLLLLALFGITLLISLGVGLHEALGKAAYYRASEEISEIIIAIQWPETWGPIVFRVRAEAVNSLERDALTTNLNNVEVVGLPAPRDLDVYIWSFGANRESGQAVYRPSHDYPPPAKQHYRRSDEDTSAVGTT